MKIKKNDRVYVVLTDGSIQEGWFTGRIVKLLSLVRLEIALSDMTRLCDLGRCIPKTEETAAMVATRNDAIVAKHRADELAIFTLEQLWFKRLTPQDL